MEKYASKKKSEKLDYIPKPVFSWDGMKQQTPKPTYDDSSGEKLAHAKYWENLFKNRELVRANLAKSELEVKELFKSGNAQELAATALIYYAAEGKNSKKWSNALREEKLRPLPLEFVSSETGLRVSTPVVYGVEEKGRKKVYSIINPRDGSKHEGETLGNAFKSFVKNSGLPSGTLYVQASPELKEFFGGEGELAGIKIEGKEKTLRGKLDVWMAFLGATSLVSLAIPEPLVSKTVALATGIPAGAYFTATSGYDLLLQYKLETLGANSETAKNMGMFLSGAMMGKGKIFTVLRTSGNVLFASGLNMDVAEAVAGIQKRAEAENWKKEEKVKELLKLAGMVGLNIALMEVARRAPQARKKALENLERRNLNKYVEGAVTRVERLHKLESSSSGKFHKDAVRWARSALEADMYNALLRQEPGAEKAVEAGARAWRSSGEVLSKGGLEGTMEAHLRNLEYYSKMYAVGSKPREDMKRILNLVYQGAR
ncbi:MAG: hypothetical protein ABIH99_00860 [Candidatus Micrarchaeota archaeon]